MNAPLVVTDMSDEVSDPDVTLILYLLPPMFTPHTFEHAAWGAVTASASNLVPEPANTLARLQQGRPLLSIDKLPRCEGRVSAVTNGEGCSSVTRRV